MLLPSDRSAWTLRHRLIWYSWLVMLVLLPITSQPHLANLIGGRPVNPPSLIPSTLILLVGVIPFWVRGGHVPRPAVPLILFLLVAVFAAGLSPFLGLQPFQGIDLVDRTVRGLGTLGLGFSFYLAAVYLPTRHDLLRDSLRAIAIGAVPALLWATLQPLQYPPVPLRDTMDAIHESLFSLRPLFRDRVTGMAVEPSWFADQLVLCYLPIWASAVLCRTSAFGPRGRWPWVETALLGWGGLMLLLTSSRSGYAAWGTVLIALALAGGWAAGRRGWVWLQGKGAAGDFGSRRASGRFAGPVGAAFAVTVVAALGITVVLVSARLDRRMDRLLRLELDGETSTQRPLFLTMARELEYAERVTYWTAASRVFALHPILGVGLGNSGFLFPEVIPATGYDLVDVLGAVGVAPGSFPNPKSLWFRLPAESGIVGFVLFSTWLTVVAACAWSVMCRNRGLASVIGMATLLSLIALLVEGFSLDTLALPYLWLLPGMATGLWSRPPIVDVEGTP